MVRSLLYVQLILYGSKVGKGSLAVYRGLVSCLAPPTHPIPECVGSEEGLGTRTRLTEGVANLHTQYLALPDIYKSFTEELEIR